MTLASYDPKMTMREARALYFAINRFGEGGGYEDDWVDFKLGPLPMPFPNTGARRRAVRYHDLHHIVTGYDTDTVGEFEISAWELGAGCRDFFAAWQLNLGGLAAGLFAAPKRVFRAFVRGRSSRSLYGLPLEGLLSRPVGEVKREVGLDIEPPPATLKDTALFALSAVAGLAVGLTFVPFMMALAPLAIGAGLLRRRAASRAGAAALAAPGRS
jgi:hypothetical protein